MATRLGLKFRITEEERMNCLLNKVSGASWLGWCCEEDIETEDLYGDEEPWEVFEKNRGGEGEDERYFFTELKGVGRIGKKSELRVCRNVGKAGTWSNKGQKTPIFGRKGCIIGHKRSFRYEVKKGSNSDSDSDYDWLLKEYTLPDVVKRQLKQKYGGANFALCILKRRRKMKKGWPAAPLVEEEEEELVEDVDEWLSQRGYARGASSSRSLMQAVVDMEEEDDRAVKMDDSCLQQVGENELLSIPVEDSSSGRSLEEITEWLLQQPTSDTVDQLLDKSSVVDECSIASAPPFDLSSSCLEGENAFTELADFDSGDFRAVPPSNYQFAWEDDFQFPWAAGGLQQLLTVSVL